MNVNFRLLVPLTVLVLALILLGFMLFAYPRAEGTKTEGKVEIGGPFSLVDTKGNAVNDAAFRGKIMLVYFGFTYCPDICPTELQAISSALDLLGSQAQGVAPLFITVDPARDTPAVMADYLSHFHPAIMGLSGSPAAIADAAARYKVYYRKIEDEESGAPYTVDHLSVVFLMDGQGRYLSHFTQNTEPSEMADTIAAALAHSK